MADEAESTSPAVEASAPEEAPAPEAAAPEAAAPEAAGPAAAQTPGPAKPAPAASKKEEPKEAPKKESVASGLAKKEKDDDLLMKWIKELLRMLIELYEAQEAAQKNMKGLEDAKEQQQEAQQEQQEQQQEEPEDILGDSFMQDLDNENDQTPEMAGPEQDNQDPAVEMSAPASSIKAESVNNPDFLQGVDAPASGAESSSPEKSNDLEETAENANSMAMGG
ncbi:hypothetical protein ACFORL_11855 [Legionella dresdenensis]|uniref:Coiled-coil protein n=1 Tax=Legionella dresdenensis TaxID=450200 RepID=A0ABV8CHL5_9GAMM